MRSTVASGWDRSWLEKVRPWVRSARSSVVERYWQQLGKIGGGGFRGWERLRGIGERNRGKREWTDEREEKRKSKEREERKENKKLLKFIPFLSVLSYIWDGIVAVWHIFWDLEHLIKLHFWCLMCQMPNIWHLTNLLRMLLQVRIHFSYLTIL